nr:chitobiosyldiphosphodolichol [Hymenolepis microstoma]
MPSRPSVHILVLGDVTRSPRIKNHSKSFAKEGWRVKFSGYMGSQPDTDEDIQYCYIPEPPSCLDVLPRILSLPLKWLFLSVCLLFHLILHMREDIILVQSPPAAPTFSVINFFAFFKGCPICIDWHNYGYTILSATSRQQTLTASIYKFMEISFAAWFFNPKSYVKTSHFTVSEALKEDLLRQTGIDAIVVYDRPTNEFKPTSLEDAHKLFIRLSQTYPQLRNLSGSTEGTVFTEVSSPPNGSCQWRSDRPALVVSGCSWTPDDDFTVMIEALDIYNTVVASSPNIHYHKLICIVTGKGPLKTHFQAMIAERNWEHVEVLTPWLEWNDYLLLLGSADLGVSLHHSTSNLDLPMKVVDLLGAEVPVLALTYPALSELLPDGQLGYHFSTPNELANHLEQLLMPKEDFQGVGDSLDLIRLRRNIHTLKQSPDMSWHTHWCSTVLPVCRQLVSAR